MKGFVISLLFVFLISGCEMRKDTGIAPLEKVEELLESITITELFHEKPVTAEDINITKELLFDKYTFYSTNIPLRMFIRTRTPCVP